MLSELTFAAGLTTAAVMDLRVRRVPNLLNVALLTGGLLYQSHQGGLLGLGRGIAGVLTALALLCLPFAARWFGGGDVKLSMAMGAWLGPYDTVLAVAGGLVVGGALALVIYVRARPLTRQEIHQNLILAFATRSLAIPGQGRPKAETVPLAVGLAVAAGVVAYLRGGLHGSL